MIVFVYSYCTYAYEAYWSLIICHICLRVHIQNCLFPFFFFWKTPNYFVLYLPEMFQFGSVMSNSLQPHGSQHCRPSCLSPAPGACSNSCPSSRWCHPSTSSSGSPLLFLPSIFPSFRVFSRESVLCIRWPKCWNVSISPSNEYSGLISSRIDSFHLLAMKHSLVKHLDWCALSVQRVWLFVCYHGFGSLNKHMTI